MIFDILSGLEYKSGHWKENAANVCLIINNNNGLFFLQTKKKTPILYIYKKAFFSFFTVNGIMVQNCMFLT